MHASALKVIHRILVTPVFALACITNAAAQSSADAEMEMLESLPPAQREAVLRQLQGQSPGVQDLPLDSPTLIEAVPESEDFGASYRLAPGDTVVVQIEVGTSGSANDGFVEKLHRGNPYRLDRSGALDLPGVEAIPLAGLRVSEAIVRLRAEHVLEDLGISLALLPLDPVGVDALTKFGYGLFRGVPTTFAPATDIPVPVDYIIGPGDTINIQLFGNENIKHLLVVNRNGLINLPEIGPVEVAGLTFETLRDELIARVNEQMIGVRASVTMDRLRSIRIFVLGDVARPGSYTVSGLSTMTNAIFVSGGITTIGSLRRIDLRRNGVTVSSLDLYDLLLHGDTSDDERLKPGDVIFAPPVGDTVAIHGEVKRPAIYETRGETTISELVEIAGGFKASANQSTIKLERIESNEGIAVREFDLASARGVVVSDGDVVHIGSGLGRLLQAVRLSGNVHKPGIYEWHAGMRLTELLVSPLVLKAKTDINYLLIRRENEARTGIDVLSADLEAAWQAPGGSQDLILHARDTIYVFNREVGRGRIVNDLIGELRSGARSNQPVPVAQIGGEVRAQGMYPLDIGMRVSDLIRAGGGLMESAYIAHAELARYDVIDGEYVELEVIDIDITRALTGDSQADLKLKPHDHLIIKPVQSWNQRHTVELKGEIVFPGTYAIKPQERLSELLRRAGGLTDRAFVQGTIFLRSDLREREQDQLNLLASRLERELLASFTQWSEPDTYQRLSVGRQLVQDLRAATPMGRLVIDLKAIIAANLDRDIILENGDVLIVPDAVQEVTVLGEVQYPTSHLYKPGLDRGDYIMRSGGFTRKADSRRAYVVRADGQVMAGRSSLFFARGREARMLPGDTIVVPVDTEGMPAVLFWSKATQILYNLGIAAAAVNALGS